MIGQAQIKVKINDSEKVLSLNEALKVYNEYTKKGGVCPIQLYTYNPNNKRFSYQVPVAFRPINNVNKIMAIEVDCSTKEEKDKFAKILVDVTTKVLIKCNNLATTVPIGNFTMLSGAKMTIAFINEKGEIEYKPIRKVYDPFDPHKVKAVEPPKEEVKKRGRKKKEDKPVEYNSLRVETRDGSLFVVDHLVMK